MRHRLSALLIAGMGLVLLPATALADLLPSANGSPWQMAQNFGDVNSRTQTRDRPPPRQRYVCVVPSQPSDRNGGANVCRAAEGRVGGSCRCPGTVGSGRLQFD